MSRVTRRDFAKVGLAGAAGVAFGAPRILADEDRAPRAGGPRIAVIGAGVAGLTAAHTLKRLGYANVTVYERWVQPGGKVLTDHSLGAPLELGAVFATDRYSTTAALAREVGAPTAPIGGNPPVLDEDGTLVPLREFAVRKHGATAVKGAMQQYRELADRHRVFERRGFAGLPPELFVSFQEFAEKNGLVPVADMFRAQAVTYGYAFFETIPALYMLKGLELVDTDQFFLFPLGYQDLWIRVASGLDVRCSAAVTAVRRRAGPNGPRIAVEVNGDEQVFERLVVATPCDLTARYLDLTGEEQDLFGPVLRNDYRVTLARVEGMNPERRALYLYRSTSPSAAGHVMLWYGPAPAQPVFMAYQNVGAGQTDAEAQRLLEEDFREVGGGTVTGVILHRKWDYFEHVRKPTLAEGYYDRFEALQGKNRTWFVTGLLALESVETCARYARRLMEEAFAPLAG